MSEAKAPTVVDNVLGFYRQYCDEAIAQLARAYPRDSKSLDVDYSELYRYDVDLADDLRSTPNNIIEFMEEALRQYDLPVDVDLSGANVRVFNLPTAHYPGEVSPSNDKNTYLSITGEVTKSTGNYSILKNAAYVCQRCGTLTNVPQPSYGEQNEPYECKGCDRQGPFEIDHDRSHHVDGQKVRVKTPPEVARGNATDIDAILEDDITGQIQAGDRVTLSGILKVRSKGGTSKNSIKFDPYLETYHVDVDESDAEEVEIEESVEQEIQDLADGKKGNPLDVAAQSYAPKIWGYEPVKKALILALVGGSRIEYSGNNFDRGEFHVLLIGDPSTAKSKLITRAEEVGWRSVGVSSTGATKAGVTASAVRDEFTEGNTATLEAGALVKANRGVVAIDELDDMPAEVRSALLEPMSKQVINVSKWGINSRLETRTAVVAAANPEDDRFDPFQPIVEQFDFESSLLTRFDLVFTFKDRPDEDDDEKMADHVLKTRDAHKRLERDEVLPEDIDDPRPPVHPDTLRQWIAVAKRQPKPIFADGVRERIRDQYVELRGMYGYDEDEDTPVPVTMRSLEGIVRVAEAAAKFELSDRIEERHAEIATSLVGESMRDIGRDPETGEFDADVHETGASKSQKNRKETVITTVLELQHGGDDDFADRETVIEEAASKAGVDETTIERDVEKFLSGNGELMEPRTGKLRKV